MTSSRFASSSAERVAALHRYDILGTPDEAAFDRLADLAAYLLKAPMAGVHFIDDHCQWAKAQTGLDAKTLDLDVSFCVHGLGSEEVLVVEDATADPRFVDNPLVTGDLGIRFYAGAALMTPDGHALGRLCVIDTAPRPDGLDIRERETLRQLAGVVMDEMAYRAQPRHREEVLESITDGFLAVDPDWHITYINQRGAALLQRPQDELLGRYIWDEFPEAMELAFYEEYERVMDTGEAADFEAYFPPLQTWFHVKAYPFEGGLSIYFDDVTERKEHEQALRESRLLLEKSQRIAHLGHWDWNVEAGTTQWSDEIYRILGHEPGAFEPSVDSYFEAIPEPDRARSQALMREALDTGRIKPENRRIEHRVVCPDGTERVVELEAQIVDTDATGQPARLLGTVLDVTRRHEREEQLRLMSRAVEDAAEAVLITEAVIDEPGPRIEYANPAFEEATGYSEQEVIGKTPRILQGEGTDRAALDRMRAAFEQWQPVKETVLNYRKDGTPFWNELYIAPVADESGWYTHWVSIQRDVTEQYERREALETQRERLEMALIGGSIGMWDWDMETGATVYDERWADILGYDLDEVAFENTFFERHTHPEDLERVYAEIERHARGEIPYLDQEIRMRHKDGSWRWILDRAKIVARDTDGTPLRMVGTHVDITERKEAEEELRRQHDLLENIFDTSPAAIVTLDAEGQLAVASPRAQEVLGLEPSAVTERAYNDPAWRIMTAQGEPMPEEELPFTRVMAAGEPVEDLELSIERPDGTRRLLSASGAPLHGAGGELDGAVFVLEDITDRRRQEAIEQRFGSLLQAAPSEIYIFDAETLRFTQTSRGARTNLGYPEAELDAMTPLDLKPYDKAEFEALIQPLRTGEEELISFETTHRRKDGTTYPVQVRLQLSREEHAPVFVAIVLDITERTRRERELIAAKERAEEMSRLKSAFLANMSHEIRTPLTSIIGFTDVIAGQVEGKSKELLGMIRESGKRLEETLTSVLDLAKIEGESMQVEPERVDLAEEVRTATGLFRPKAEVKEIDLRLDMPADPAEATLDVRVLRRVLANLIANAVKFTEEGQVTVRLRVTGEEATVEIEDTGVGIAPDQMDRIFEEFAQESEGYTRSHEGVGLGLSITRRLVGLLGGRIEAESEKSVGSLFRVTLPREYPVAAEQSGDPEDVGGSEALGSLGRGLGVEVPPRARRDASRYGEARVKERPPVIKRAVTQRDKTRVLLVEDNELTRQVMPMLLQKADAGYAMDVAESAEEALKMAEARGYDLFLIDVNLGPGPTGLDLMQRLRATARYAETPMIACTAYAMPGDKESFLEAGFDAYLAKPFGSKQLLETLQHALER